MLWGDNTNIFLSGAGNMTKEEFIRIARGCIPTAHSAVEALSLAEKLEWDVVRSKLMGEARTLSLMPSDIAVVERLVASFGYIRQPINIGQTSADAARKYMNASYQTPGIRAIAKIKGLSRSGGGTMVPLLPLQRQGTENILYEYRWAAPISANLRVDDIYIHADGGDDLVLARRRSVGRKKIPVAPPPKDTEYFHYYQANPAGKATGDCLIRAIATATGMTWDETLDGLARFAGESTLLNIHRVFEPYLHHIGFQRHHVSLRSDGHWPTGAQLCEMLDQEYQNSEKIVAFIGRSHMTAIFPVQTSQGSAYKIVDEFDCSDWVVSEYWSANR